MIKSLKTRSAMAAVGLLAVTGLTLSACTTATTPAPAAPTVTVTAEPVTPATPTPAPEKPREPLTKPDTGSGNNTGKISDSEFVALVKENQPIVSSESSYNIVNLAKVSCDAFDSGATATEVLTTAAGSTSNPALQEAFGFIIGAGVANYCPVHLPKIQALSNTL